MAKANPTKRDPSRKAKSGRALICVTTAQPCTADPYWRTSYVSLRRKGKREPNPNVVAQAI